MQRLLRNFLSRLLTLLWARLLCERSLLALTAGFVLVLPLKSTADPYQPEKLVFGGDAGYRPFEWLRNGHPVGFNVDLAYALASDGPVPVEYQLGSWRGTVAALEAGRVDVVPMFVSGERRERFLFTSPFYVVSHAIYSLPDTPAIYTPRNLEGSRVVVEQESFAAQELRAKQIAVNPLLSADMREALAMLISRQADYAILAVATADEIIHTESLPVIRRGPPFWPRNYAFAVRKERVELVQWLQQALDATLASGRYQQIYEKWQPQLERGKSDYTLIISVVAAAIGALALLALLAAAWSWTLRHKVAARTGQLEKALLQNQQAEAYARHLANFDSDTQLPKAQHFLSLADETLASAEPGSAGREMLVVQLTELSEVVGTLGKAYSEDLLQAFARLLKAATDGCCGYLGRGVFAALGCRHKESLFSVLTERQSQQSRDFHFFLVGGSAHWPEHGKTARDLLAHAETALAASLANAQRITVYAPSMEPDPLSLEVLAAFREGALEGMYAVFQPQIELDTGKVVAAEALVRWDHPRYGYLPPSRFVPVAEKTGLIPQITAIMLDEAVRVGVRLRRMGRPCLISVNVAIYDLLQTDLAKTINDTLARHGGLAGDLKLEITETSVAKEPSCVGAVLKRLSQQGISLSVDDFGTGYSSLCYLSVFPIHELKIDQAFVRDMATNSKNRSIVRSTIVMAKELGLRTVAEGVEDLEVLAMLRLDGCDRVQGFVCSKPLDEEDFVAYLREHD